MKAIVLIFAVVLLSGAAIAPAPVVEDAEKPFSHLLFERVVSRTIQRPVGGIVPTSSGVVGFDPSKLKASINITPIVTHGVCDDRDDFESYCEAACAAAGQGSQVCNVEFAVGNDNQWASCGQANAAGDCIGTPSAECGAACI